MFVDSASRRFSFKHQNQNEERNKIGYYLRKYKKTNPNTRHNTPGIPRNKDKN